MDNSFENKRMFRYSVNKLIQLVKNRPIIWDSSRPDFRSFNNKEIAWKEVYKELDDTYRMANDRRRSEIGLRITTKWRNIRDAFIRSQRKRAQHSEVKRYMHHDRLSFMLKLINTDGTFKNQSRQMSSNSESNITEGSISYDDGSVGEPLVTVVKLEPEVEDRTYSITTVTEPNNHTFATVQEPTECNDLVASQIKVEVEDEKPTYSDEDSTSLKGKLTDTANESEVEVSKLKVRILEKEDRPVEEKDEAEDLKLSESFTNSVKELRIVSPSALDGDESFFASILSFVRDMNEDEKLEFRMNVLQMIQGIRSRKQSTTASK